MNKYEKMVAEVPGLSSGEAFLLYRLANMADPQGKCWPSIRTLSQETRFAQRTIYYLLNGLEARNIIIRYPARGRSTLYALNFEDVLECVKKEEKDRWGRSQRKNFDQGCPEEPGESETIEEEELGPEYQEYRSYILRKYPSTKLSEERIIRMWKKSIGSITV